MLSLEAQALKLLSMEFNYMDQHTKHYHYLCQLMDLNLSYGHFLKRFSETK